MVRKCSVLLIVFGIALASLTSVTLSGTQAQEKGTVQLFNGTDLKGWRIFLDPKSKLKANAEDVFKVKDGVIHCAGRPNGYLITEKEFSNFVLEVEWRWPEKGGNSGVFVHVAGPDNIWPKGVEAQLSSGSAGDFWLVGNYKLTVDKTRQDKKISRHYFRLKSDKQIENKIGEWNKYRITCKGNSVRLEINGHFVNEGTEAESMQGKILLQSEGTPVEFRNIRLTPLN